MRCKCGHVFEQEADHESYALVNDKDYVKFLVAEIEVQQCADEEARQAAIARSSQYVGFVLECPKCSRLVVHTAGAKALAFYKRDE